MTSHIPSQNEAKDHHAPVSSCKKTELKLHYNGFDIHTRTEYGYAEDEMSLG